MKKKLVLTLAVLLLLLGLSLWFGWNRHYENTHVFVEDAVYDRDARFLDLRGQKISVAHYEALRQALPLCDILWDVPFQDTAYPSDTRSITLTALSETDVEQLDYLTELETVDARECRDYEAIASLQQRRPECEIDYQVLLNGEGYAKNTESLSFTRGNGEELLENLRYLPRLKSVHFADGALEAADLLQLREAYPDISFTWEKEVLGALYPNDITEFDFSGTPLSTVDELEEAMEYFPDLEKLILCDTGIDDETMAAFRERVRDSYKVVWRVKLGRIDIRTDETTFMPRKVGVNMQNHEMENLKYCEDMLVVDVGHMGLIKDLEWLYGMPHLQFLILVGTGVEDLTPIGSLKELIYLELFKSPNVYDYSPLVGCTALQDVNLACTHGDSKVFADMPWLKHLWINQTGVDAETRALLTEKLPNTVIEFDHGWHMGNGWRDLDNYYVMRDLLEMPYYNWGSSRK